MRGVMTRSLEWRGVPIALAAFGLSLLLLVARLPESVFRAEFWAEDGLFYGTALANGPASVLEPYAGFLFVALRAVALAETAIPPPLAPLLGNLTALVSLALVATFAVTARFPWSRRTSILVAAALVVAPASKEVIGTASHLHYPIAAWLALLPWSRPPESTPGKVAESVPLVIAGLTGPFALLFAPLYLFGPRRRLAVIATTGLIQLAVLIAGSRRPAGAFEADLLPTIVTDRAMAVVVGRTLADILPGVVAAVILVSVGWGLARLPRHRAVWLVWVAIIPVAAGILALPGGTVAFLHPDTGLRHFWLPSVAVGWVVALAWRVPAVILLGVLFAIGVVVEFRLDAAPRMGWEERSACIGGPVPCAIPVAPNEGDRWTVFWTP